MKYICDTCNKVFSQKSNYDYHINRKYKCSLKEDVNNLKLNIPPSSTKTPPKYHQIPPKPHQIPPIYSN